MSERPIDADVAPGVEWAERGPDFQRRVGEPARVRNRPAGPPEVADDDLVVERKDLGPSRARSSPRATPFRLLCVSFLDAQRSRLHARSRPWAGGTAGSGPGSPTVRR
jgi:hypothetical protein